jgi:hypothetical protein
VKPAGTVGMVAAGLSTNVPKLGFGTPTGESLFATGCGGRFRLPGHHDAETCDHDGSGGRDSRKLGIH